MNNAPNASRWPGVTAVSGVVKVRATICPRLVEPALSASAKMASATVGSASAATVISRLAPIPPNGEPGSSPARERKKVPSSSRYTTTRRSPTPSSGSGTARIGTRNATATVLANTTNGAARKIQEAFRETTTSFRNSLASSRYGCQAGAPRRFWSLALTHRTSPTSPGASASASAVWPSSRA